MGKTFCGLVLLAICTAGAAVTDQASCLDTEYEREVSSALWESLFAKINTILNETSRLGESQKGHTENLKAVTESLRALSENQIALTESQKALSASLAQLKERQEVQERNLSEFINDAEKHFSTLEERQLSQARESSIFIESAQENFTAVQQGLVEQQNKLSYFMDQYFDNNVEWTTILRRQDGSVDFYRNWTEYQKGFGDVNGEFFIGLDKLHNLTTKGAPQELLIILKDNENERRIAKYDLFKIGNEAEKYALLEVGAYSGDAGDALRADYHKGMSFTTYDQDNDKHNDKNCAKFWHGAWWFNNCYVSHLFGAYKPQESNGIGWNEWSGIGSSLKFAEMKIRSKIIKASKTY